VGNPVYATGDGVVEKVDFKYTGYGNEVVIDHGFGYKTRYAHLNTIDVGVGQVLKRGDRIGEIGKSGKVTGPHLHYEVVFKGSQINPMSFMDMEMPVEEYRAMIGKRSAAAVGGPPPSAASMSERQKKQGTNGRQ
jgi:murein DD-endopeptidase MepM/ murein hydrolase activator NlpD